MKRSLAPIVVFVYNRPWHTQLTIDALKKNELAEQSDLFIYSDGCKSISDQVKVDEVRSILKTTAGFKSITVFEKEKNWGLANSVIKGVTDIINKHGKVIVVEDDLVTSPYFLRFMNEALLFYEFEDRVMQISGYMFPINLNATKTAMFLPFTSSWGWATWERSWLHFDSSTHGCELLKNNKQMKHEFDLDSRVSYFEMFERQRKGLIDSWAIRWYWSVFRCKGLTLFPPQTLVQNNGMDGSGVHCGNMKMKQAELYASNKSIELPSDLIVSNAYNAIVKSMRPSWGKIIAYKIKAFLIMCRSKI